jgi:hypothetical protein
MNVGRYLRRKPSCDARCLVFFVTVSCGDKELVQPAGPETPTAGAKPPGGVYEFTVTGLGTSDMHATGRQVIDASGHYVDLPAGVQATLNPVASGLVFELGTVVSFTEGARNQDGQRYITLTYRRPQRNRRALNNLTLIPNTTASTIAGTPWLSLKLFDGTNASTTIAERIAPTGATALGEDFQMKSLYPDVLQVFNELEIAAIHTTGRVTGFFPYGFMVRNRINPASRNIPVAVDANDYAGVLTFRVPFSIDGRERDGSVLIHFLGDRCGRYGNENDGELRRGAGFDGGTAPSPARDRARCDDGHRSRRKQRGRSRRPRLSRAAPNLFGPNRRKCGSSHVIHQHARRIFSFDAVLAGETVDACAAYFRAGTSGRPATNVPFFITVRAFRPLRELENGNPRHRAPGADVGRTARPWPSVALASGQASLSVTYTDYATSYLAAIGARIRDTRSLGVYGVTRTWTAGAGTIDWHTNSNWSPAAVPMSLDSVYIPAAAPLMPSLAANVQVYGVTVEPAATISLGAFNLTAGASVSTGTTGGITNTTGVLILAGTAMTVQGVLPPLRVTGTYALAGNVTTRAPLRVDAGRLTSSSFRLTSNSN